MVTGIRVVRNASVDIHTDTVTSGTLPVSRGGTTNVNGSSGSLVYTTAPALSTVHVSDTLYAGNITSNTAIYATSGILGVRSNGTNTLTVSSSGLNVTGTLNSTSYSGNGFGLSSLLFANTAGSLPVVNGGTGTTTSTGTAGNVVLSEGPTLSNMVAKNALYIGTLASNTAVVDGGNGVLGFRANGVNIANLTTTGLNVAGTISGNAVSITSSAQTVIQSTIQTSYGTWTSRTPAADNQWYSVCYGNGLYVAVSLNGAPSQVMTSPDGITWTSRTSAVNNTWYSVCYGNGLFVAVAPGAGSGVMTSPDGVTWTVRSGAVPNNWRSVCYGNGLFVAVSTNGIGTRVMTSPDGITWTSRTNAAGNYWTGVCYGNGLYVAVSASGTGNRVMTSPDGITWTSRTSATDNDWYGICYGNGLFVAVSGTGTGDRVMTSPDGITWTSRTSAANNNWYSVCYGNTKFIAVAGSGSGDRVMSSTDGITWTTESSAQNNTWQSVCWGADKFAAVSIDYVTGVRVMTSTFVTTPSLGLGKTAGTGYQLDLSTDTARKLTSTTWTTGSDRRIKEEIEDANLDMCVELVESIPLKRFAWKASYAPSQTDRHQLGWIAQDVEETGLEKVVTISEDHGYPDFRSLNTDQLYKVMWGALQHSIRKVRDLKEQLQ